MDIIWACKDGELIVPVPVLVVVIVVPPPPPPIVAVAAIVVDGERLLALTESPSDVESATISGARNMGVPANFDKSESSMRIGSR